MFTINPHPADSKLAMQVSWRMLCLVLVITLLLILQGCSTSPKPRTDQLEPAPEVLKPSIIANQLMLDGQFAEAARLYFQQAIEAEGDEREQLLLLAADAWLMADNLDEVTTTLAYISQKNLNPDLTLHYRLLLTELSLRHGQIESALDLLEPPPTDEQPIALRQRYHSDKAEAFRLAGNILESVHERDLLDTLLHETERRLENQKAIITTLSTLTESALELLQPDPPGRLGGWMALALTIKRATTQEELTTQIAIWRETFPQHPALPDLYLALPIELPHHTDHIAVLLPINGPYAKVAAAVRDGLLAAYFSQPAELRPRLQFYDSSNQESIWPLYQQAIDAGAKMVLGPLNRQAASQLASADELDVPTLVLNTIDNPNSIPPQLYQYGLFPEDEAKQVAERAWLDGHSHALVLTPANDWGRRIANSFSKRWQALGGTIAEQQEYVAKENDFSIPIKSLFNIDQSNQRRRQLENLLGLKVKFEPRRRQDADFIFLAARSQKGRQIRPQLQFHHAGNLPLYATSHIYSGTPNRDKDKDLGHLLFPDIPWVLEEDETGPLSRLHLSRELSTFQNRYARFYAMGIDSYTLLPQLERLQQSTGETLNGMTGTLYLDNPNQIHRQLVWAEMRNGKSRIIGYAPRIEQVNPYPTEQLPAEEALPVEAIKRNPVKIESPPDAT